MALFPVEAAMALWSWVEDKDEGEGVRVGAFDARGRVGERDEADVRGQVRWELALYGSWTTCRLGTFWRTTFAGSRCQREKSVDDSGRERVRERETMRWQ